MPPLRLTRSATTTRSLCTSTPRPASILFSLHALSNSRETQHLNKLSRLSRIEHSPPLKLIQTGEVDAWPLPTREKATAAVAGGGEGGRRALRERRCDGGARRIGGAVWADRARYACRMRWVTARAKRRESAWKEMYVREKGGWARERERLRGEMRSAGRWILVAVGVAAGLGMWIFWPEGAAAAAEDSGLVGRRLAERAQNAVPLPRAGAAVQSPLTGVTGPAISGVEHAAPKTVQRRVESEEEHSGGGGSWWRGLFWK